MRKPSGEDFSQPSQTSQNKIGPSDGWDPSPSNDSPLVGSDSYNSTLPSPSSPDPLVSPYTLAREEFNPDIKANQAFNSGTFDDWMRWNDPNDIAFSPTLDFFPELKAEPSSPTMSGLKLQGSGVGSAVSDENMFTEDTEEPLFQSLNDQRINDLPRENLYSTPLSWSRPSPGRGYMNMSTLSPHQESALRNIAMPSSSFPGSPSSTSSPEASDPSLSHPSSSSKNPSRKRKSCLEISEQEQEQDHEPDLSHDEDDSSPPHRSAPVKKIAHNMIEKRYRTNLNDKIALLRDSVPSLRVMSQKKRSSPSQQEDLQGLTPAHKLNKATVLSKATEYIAHLEKRNLGLGKENRELRSRVDAFEMLVIAGQEGTGQGGMSVMQGGMGMGQQRGFGGLEGMSGIM